MERKKTKMYVEFDATLIFAHPFQWCGFNVEFYRYFQLMKLRSNCHHSAVRFGIQSTNGDVNDAYHVYDYSKSKPLNLFTFWSILPLLNVSFADILTNPLIFISHTMKLVWKHTTNKYRLMYMWNAISIMTSHSHFWCIISICLLTRDK